MDRLSKTLPAGWTLGMPEPAGDPSGIARALKGGLTVHIRWALPADDKANDADQFRALAVRELPSCDDWVLTAFDGNQRTAIPDEIRDWAVNEARNLYTAFHDLA